MKEYIKTTGEKSVYDYSEYNKNYEREAQIYKLQKQKSYYKKIKNMDKYYQIEEEIRAYKERHGLLYKERKTKKVVQLDLDGNVIRTWDSAKQAAEELLISKTSIVNCLNEYSKSSGGFNWKYVEEETE